MMKNAMLLAGAGQIGMAIVRRVGAGMKIVVADKKLEVLQPRKIRDTLHACQLAKRCNRVLFLRSAEAAGKLA